jgi:hypothetical protein
MTRTTTAATSTFQRAEAMIREAGFDPDETEHPAYAPLADAASAIVLAEDTVRRLSVQMVQRMHDVQGRLDDGCSLNELGELQARGPELDVAVAILQDRKAAWHRLVRLVEVIDGLAGQIGRMEEVIAELQSIPPDPLIKLVRDREAAEAKSAGPVE